MRHAVAVARIAQLLADGRTYSCEFFPPKNEAGWLSLGRTISELEHLRPDFVSVTYGAGGSTRTRTADLVSWVRRQTHIAPMAHLTCQGHTRGDVRAILTDYQAEGVENILALGGDPQKVNPLQPVELVIDHSVQVDHFGTARAALGRDQPGFAALLALVASGKAYVKLSGGYRISGDPDWADIPPLAEALIAANPERVVYLAGHDMQRESLADLPLAEFAEMAAGGATPGCGAWLRADSAWRRSTSSS